MILRLETGWGTRSGWSDTSCVVSPCVFWLYLSDVDECGSTLRHCSHGCVNTFGSFFCSCPPGFTVDSSGLQCVGPSQQQYTHCHTTVHFIKVKKVKAMISCSWETHLRTTGCHLPYGITQCYLPPDTSEHSTHLALTPASKAGTRFTYLSRDGRLS